MLSFFAYIFAISCIWRTKAVDLENVFANFDQLYSKLLNLSPSENDNFAENFDAELDQNLKSTLDAAILYSNIKEMLNVNEIKNTKKTAKILNNKNAQNLKEITKKFSTATEVSLVNICNLWKFWRELGDIYVENHKNQKEIKEFAKVRDKINLDGFECDENIKNNRIYNRDLALANYSAIVFLLQRKNKRNKWIKVGNAHEYNTRAFLEFFDKEKMENETNFAYQLRRLRINYTENIEIILKFKTKIKELIGPFLLPSLEFIRPFEIAFECIDDNMLVTDYTKILSEDETISIFAATTVTVRIVFGRIMLIFSKMYKMWKSLKVNSRKTIEMLWNQILLLNLNDDIQKNGFNMLADIYVFYQNLVTIYNDIPGLTPDEQIYILSDNKKILPNFNEKKLMPSVKTLEMAWDDLLEEHAKNVIRFNQSINVFSSLLKDSLMLSKRTKSSLHAFFVSNTKNGTKIFNKLTKKYPALLSMIREELTDDQIEELQMRNYIKFLNVRSSLLESNQARVILNLVNFYQWLKHLRDKQHSSDKKAKLDNKMVELELKLDAIVTELSVNTFMNIEANLMNDIKMFELQQNANDNEAKKWHPEIVIELINKSQKFREQLKSHSINKARAASIGISMETIPNYKNSFAPDGQSSNILQDECDEEKENEEDTALYELRSMENQYREIMMHENPINAFIMKDMIMINATYFQCKQWLKQILQIVDKIKSKTNAKIGWVASRVDSELTKIKFDEKSFVDKAYKIENICEMAHLLSHIYVQKDLKSIAKWNEFVNKNGIDAFVENLNIMDISDSKELKKSNCDDQRVKDHILSAINGSPTCEQIHMRIISKLLNERASFVQFIFEKASQSLKAHELGDQQLIFYKTFLSSDIKSVGMWETKMIMQFLLQNIAKIVKHLQALHTSKRNEIFETPNNSFDPKNSKKLETMTNIQMARHLIAQAETFTKFSQMFQENIEPYSQISTGQVEVSAMIKVIEIFVDKLHCVRMICPLLRFAKFLDNITQMPNIKWHTPYECFSANFDEIFAVQNVLLANVHFKFLQNYLKNCEKNDEIVQILREKDGAILFLNNLVGGHHALVDLWAIPSVRKKLVNKTYFTNKLRLLEHYRQVLMCEPEISGKKKMQERFAADVFVWQNSLESERNGNEQFIEQMIDDLYLYSRFFYDLRNTEFVMETSHNLKNFVEESSKFMKKFSERISKDKNIENAWQQMLYDAHTQGNLNWIEAGNKYAEPIEAIQSLHFVEFKNLFLDNQKQEAKEILNGLTKNKIHQQNLLEFLTLNDLKKFLELANVKYNAEIFETPINQKAAKKAEKKRRQKENKKIKKQSLANNNTTTSESNIVCVENQHKIQNEFSIIETKKEESSANNENKNSTSAELKMELIDISQNSNLHSLDEFRNKLFLREKYEEFILNDISIEAKLLLDAGAFVYELQNRIKMFEELEKFAYFSKLNVSKIFKKEFEEFLFYYQKLKKIDANLVDQMFVQMYKMLEKYLNNFDTKIEEIPIKNDINRIKMQIHVKNVSLFIIRDQKFGLKWMNYGEEFKNKKLLNLFAIKNFDLNRFGIINKRFERMTQQVSLDVELYEKYLSKNKQTKYLSPIFPEISQQIHFYTDYNKITKIENYLNEKRTEGKNVNEFNKRITDALSKIHSIVNKWSNGLAHVVITGSFLLGTHTIGTDIDLICIVPGNLLGLQHFFGPKNAICNNNKCMDSGIDNIDQILYCQLCEKEGIKKLVKVMYSSVFLIKFVMDDVEFDITFVAIPNKNELSTELNEKIVENYANTLNFENDEQKKMLRTLSSYRSTLYLATLFQDNLFVNSNLTNFLANKNELDFWKNDKNSQNLRYLILTIKLWAKNNYIYANLYGYLNGITISIMATKVVLLYPNVSFNFLIEKFFVFYTFRPFHLPLQLAKLTAHPKMDPFFATNPNEYRMPVFTPIFPEQNVANFITNASVRIIREEMSNALVKLNQKEADKMNLEILLSNSVPFVEKYEMFVLVNCTSTNKSDGENFCHFVEGRIRLQMVYDLENIRTKLQLYNKIYQQTCSISDRFISTSATYCKVWLIGIHLFEEGEKTLKNALNLFDFTIKRDYLKYNYPKINAENDEKNVSKKPNRIFKHEEVEQKCQELNVNLTSIVVKRNEL